MLRTLRFVYGLYGFFFFFFGKEEINSDEVKGSSGDVREWYTEASGSSARRMRKNCMKAMAWE